MMAPPIPVHTKAATQRGTGSSAGSDHAPHGDAQHEEQAGARHAAANLVTAPLPGAVGEWTARRVLALGEQPRRAARPPEPRHAVRWLSAVAGARSAASAALGSLAAAAG